MTTYNFFVYCTDVGYEVFETLDDALDAANERVRGYLDDTWSEEVTSVSVGRITHRAKMCNQVFPEGEIDEDGLDEAGISWGSDIDYKCDYKMLPVGPAHEAAKLVEALEEIIDPVRFMKERLKEGECLNGMMAVLLGENVSYLTGIAEAALAAHRKQGGDLGIPQSLFWDEVVIEAPTKPLPDMSVDTKVVVWDNAERKYNRYFSRFEKGKLLAYEGGATSWSGGRTESWENWELAE